MKTIEGKVLTSSEKSFKTADGQAKYYENLVDFGNGAVIVTSGEALPIGEDLSFAVVRKSQRDFNARLKVVDGFSL